MTSLNIAGPILPEKAPAWIPKTHPHGKEKDSNRSTLLTSGANPSCRDAQNWFGSARTRQAVRSWLSWGIATPDPDPGSSRPAAAADPVEDRLTRLLRKNWTSHQGVRLCFLKNVILSRCALVCCLKTFRDPCSAVPTPILLPLFDLLNAWIHGLMSAMFKLYFNAAFTCQQCSITFLSEHSRAQHRKKKNSLNNVSEILEVAVCNYYFST